MNQLPPSAKEMLAHNDHHREIFDSLVARLQLARVKEVDIALVFKPDIIPDISKLVDQKDTLVSVMQMEVKPFNPEADLSEHKDMIDGIHARSVLVAGVKPDHSFDVAYQYKKSPIWTVELFRTYRDATKDGVEVRASESAADKIWNFLLYGITPAHDIPNRGQTE